LRLALDAEQAKLLRGETVAMSKLLEAAEALGRLVPPLARPPTPQHDDPAAADPRQKLWETYSAMRARGELFFEKTERSKLFDEIAALKAENERLKGGAPAEPSPQARLPENVRTLSPKGAPAASTEPRALRLLLSSRGTSLGAPMLNQTARSARRRAARGASDMSGQTDKPLKPHPPQACSGDEAKRRMAEVNAKPADLNLLAQRRAGHSCREPRQLSVQITGHDLRSLGVELVSRRAAFCGLSATRMRPAGTAAGRSIRGAGGVLRGWHGDKQSPSAGRGVPRGSCCSFHGTARALLRARGELYGWSAVALGKHLA
jgi:hypothetical protein